MISEKEVSWLQISDLHIVLSTDWNIMVEGYRKLATVIAPKFIVITGDFRDKSRDMPFDNALKFLNLLPEIFGINKHNIFLIPGNHDVNDYDSRNEVITTIIQNIENDSDCYSKYTGNTVMNLHKGFTDYKSFVCDFYKDSGVSDDRIKKSSEVYSVEWNNQINIIGVNSALISNGSREHNELIDIRFLSELNVNKDNPTIILMHHDLESIFPEHCKQLTALFEKLNVKSVLCGDAHKNLLKTYGQNHGVPCIVCGKSATQNADNYSDFGVIYYQALTDGNVSAQVFKWEKQNRQFTISHEFYRDIIKVFTFPFFDNKKVNKKKILNNSKKTTAGNEISIWLPDAESAKGYQTRFDTFTNTSQINKYLGDKHIVLGIASVKGIGKTFLLQVKRVKSSTQFRCLPKCKKPSTDNNWATECIIFNSYAPFKTDDIYNDSLILWKFSLVCYIINNEGDQSNYSFQRDIERFPMDIQLLFSPYNKKSLNNLINSILQLKQWNNLIDKYYNDVKIICFNVLESLKKKYPRKSRVAIFIDKVDQAIKQTNAEPPADCVFCPKIDGFAKCHSERKGDDYCSQDNGCQSKNCCYGCELYAGKSSNVGLRIYDESKIHKIIHINIWQYIQLALMSAADSLFAEFSGDICVFYTMRQEAFQCEAFRIGEQNQKVASRLIRLSYTKDEQREIFYDSIRAQSDAFVLYPNHVEKGQEEFRFLGIEKLCHPYCKDKNGNNKAETLFDSIYRHSFDRSRDIQRYGEELTNNLSEIQKCDTTVAREEKVKEIIETLATRLAYCSNDIESTVNPSYYTEKLRYIPNYWANNENFEKLLRMINKNLLFEDDVRRICRSFNECDECEIGDCKVKGCAHHPFSVLYSLGYLGCINKNNNNNIDSIQKFKDSSDIGYFIERDVIFLDSAVAYIIHPALTKTIESKYNRSMWHFAGFILGKGLPVDEKLWSQIMIDKESLSDAEFLNKYYVCHTTTKK